MLPSLEHAVSDQVSIPISSSQTDVVPNLDSALAIINNDTCPSQIVHPTHPMQTRSRSRTFKLKKQSYVVTHIAGTMTTTQEPTSVVEALQSEHWREAMEIEMNALMRNKT